MMRHIYRKLYLYAVLGVIFSLSLTVFAVNFFLSHNEKRMHAQFVSDQVHFVQGLLQHSPQDPQKLQTQLEQFAHSLGWRISYWKADKLVFAYGEAPPALNQEQKKQLTQDPAVEFKHDDPVRVYAYLDPAHPEAGYLQFGPRPFGGPPGPPPHPKPKAKIRPNMQPNMQPNMPAGRPPGPGGPHEGPPGGPHGFPHWWPPVLFALLMFLSLAVLLIPYVMYILKPFQELAASIERVADGDFSRPIDIGPKSDFRAIADAFNHMMDKIQAMIEEKQRLIADVSHELRSPLARMRVSLELLDKEGKGKKKYIERSIQELEELDLLISDILDVSALELNADNYPLEKVDLSRMVQENLELHQLIFAEHQLIVQATYPSEKVLINGRKDLLERALNNLLSNVLKYAPDSTQIDVEVFVNEHAGVRIRDRGPGLPAEELDKILQPFYRPDSSRTRKTGGTGLGLAIVQKIMHLHKGSIRFEWPADGERGLVAILEWPTRRQGQTERLEMGVLSKEAPQA